MSRQLFVGVPKAQAEEWRRRLASYQALLKGCRAQAEGELVYFPVHDGDYLKKWGLSATLREVLEAHQDEVAKGVEEVLPARLRPLMVRAHDRVGQVLILRLPSALRAYERELGEALLKAHRGVRTVAADRGVAGPYRVRKLRLLAGDPSLVSEHREYGLRFRMDLGQVYFSPRLATERERVVQAARPGERVVDMFAGVGPFAIGLAARAGARRVVACDLNPEAVRWLRVNGRLNRVEEKLEVRQGDVAQVLTERGWADRVVLNHPTAALEYLELAVGLARQGAELHLYALASDAATDSLSSEVRQRLAGLGHPAARVRLHRVHGYSATSGLWAVGVTLAPERRAR